MVPQCLLTLVSERNFSDGPKGDLLARRVINVDEKKDLLKRLSIRKQARKLLLIQLSTLILNVSKFIYSFTHFTNIYGLCNMH